MTLRQRAVIRQTTALVCGAAVVSLALAAHGQSADESAPTEAPEALAEPPGPSASETDQPDTRPRDAEAASPAGTASPVVAAPTEGSGTTGAAREPNPTVSLPGVGMALPGETEVADTGAEAAPPERTTGEAAPDEGEDEPEAPLTQGGIPLPRTGSSMREQGIVALIRELDESGGSNRTRQEEALRQRIALWKSEIEVDASNADRLRSDLEAENRSLRRMRTRLPWDIRKRKLSVSVARKKRADLVASRSRFNDLYDTVSAAAKRAEAKNAEYEATGAAAEELGLGVDIASSFGSVLAGTKAMADDYSAAAGLAVANAELVGDILPRLDAAIDAAAAASLLRRSRARIGATTFATGYSDLAALGRWLRDYASGSPSARAQYSILREAASPLGLAGTAVGLVIVGVGLFIGGRRLRASVLAGAEKRLTDTDDAKRDGVLWRAERGLNLVRAGLILAFLYACLRTLPLELRLSRSLMGVAIAWCGYFAAGPALRLLLSPRDAKFRLFECDDRAAGHAFGTLRALLLCCAIVLPITAALRVFDYPHLDVRAAIKLLFGVATVVLLLWLINADHDPCTLIARPGTDRARELGLLRRIAKPVISTAAVGLLVLALLGYVNLAAFLARGLVLTGLIAAIGLPLQRRVARELDRRYPPVSQPDTPEAEPVVDSRYMAIRYIERFAALALVIWMLLQAWGVRGYQVAAAFQYASQPLINVKGTRISVVGICKGVLVVLVFYWVGKLIRAQLSRSSVLTRRWDEGVRYAVASAVYYLMLVAGAMVGILVAGLDLTILAAFAGVVGIAVGFGGQDIAKNIICGLIMMLDPSINIGDYVDVAGQSGTIVDLSIRSIRIRTHDNRYVVVPNATFYTQNVVVSSQRDRKVRVTVDLSVTGDADFETVAGILTSMTLAEPGILSDPAPEVVFSKLAAALDLQLIAWTDQIDQVPAVQGRLVSHLWRALKDAEIVLA